MSEPEHAVQPAEEANPKPAAECVNPPPNGLDDLRIRTARIFPNLLFGSAGIAGLMIIAAIIRSYTAADAEDRIMVDLVQIRYFGILLGFIAVLFGIMMTWLGIASSFNLQASTGAQNSASLALAGSSPGMFFALLGTIVTLLGIYKDVHYVNSGQGDTTDQRMQDIAILVAYSRLQPMLSGEVKDAGDRNREQVTDEVNAAIKRLSEPKGTPGIKIWGTKVD